MTSRWLLLSAAALFAVACFTPVDEKDAGSTGDGGAVGGGDGGGAMGGGDGGGAMGGGGGSSSCMQASDCPATDAGVGFCGAFTQPSCIDWRCLQECGSPRSCTTDLDAGCVTCGTTRTCRAALCQGVTRQGRVETATCLTWPGTLDAMPGSTVQLSGAQCRYAFQRGNGIQVGSVIELNDGTFLADLPSLGGSCTGTRLPTGVERWAFSCDACQLVIAFF